eukprot:TRINITY_DN1774_c0_g1_i2.p1 TRINITY_DN1774_c0_g1~~TRINITY_DN1774_c0_g1_i2.p1  ORF type:complete len:1037 (-),score=224.14 TRINITY_DN1774_c0_g1_i2:194-3304(-)
MLSRFAATTRPLCSPLVHTTTPRVVRRRAPSHVWRTHGARFSGSTSVRRGASEEVIAERALDDLHAHGYLLARVNPLHPDRLMVQEEVLRSALPPSLLPLLDAERACAPYAGPLPDKAVSSWMTAIGVRGDERRRELSCAVRALCGPVGFDFSGAASESERQFLREFVRRKGLRWDESGAADGHTDVAAGGGAGAPDALQWYRAELERCEEFERTLSRRFPHSRRFGMSGIEGSLPLLNALIGAFAQAQPDASTEGLPPPRVMLSTTHRGRLEMLHCVLRRPLDSLVESWSATNGPSYDDITGGHSANVHAPLCLAHPPHTEGSGVRHTSPVHVSMPPIPAHLEAMVPTALGTARGHIASLMWGLCSPEGSANGCATPSRDHLERACKRVLPLLVHGDASFCGQGVVAEALHLGTLEHFYVGGAVHVVLNNQIGYTMETARERVGPCRTLLASDAAKSVRCPVLHVNAEDPRAVLEAAAMASEYRVRFGRDVVVNMWGFRRHGHNEMDEPRITNGALYALVDGRPTALELFDKAHPAVASGIRQPGAEPNSRAVDEEKHKHSESAEGKRACGEYSKSRRWIVESEVREDSTAVSAEELGKAFESLVRVPEHVHVHKITARHIARRRAALNAIQGRTVSGDVAIDWATAELLALATMAQKEQVLCRLSGQDVERGTFTQRHAVVRDVASGAAHKLLPARVEVCNSPVSELAVLGFELGWSLASPHTFNMWEAQFGDFANNAQAVIDTALVSEGEKWQYKSNIAVSLPHGYDGMGPEHSSARIERWLSMHVDTPEAALARAKAAPDSSPSDVPEEHSRNFSLVHPTTAANLFHVIRRQMSPDHYNPLVVLSPKRTLHHRLSTSPLRAFVHDLKPADAESECAQSPPHFVSVFDDPERNEFTEKEAVTSVWLCSGEVFFDLIKLRASAAIEAPQKVAIIRLEQLAPVPSAALVRTLALYPRAEHAAWVQEEPRNGGAATFLTPFFHTLGHSIPEAACLRATHVLSRAAAASPASGDPSIYAQRQAKLFESVSHWTNERA